MRIKEEPKALKYNKQLKLTLALAESATVVDDGDASDASI